MNHYQILGVNVSQVNPQSAVVRMAEWIASRCKVYVCVAPVSTIVDCQKDEEYRRIINGAAMVTPDGMPVVWLGRMKGHKEVDRTYGPDVMLAVCAAGSSQGFRHYFYGGTDTNNLKLISKLREKFPDIKIAGHFAPGLLKTGQKESREVIQRINASQADILWVGLGSPKQDYWMSIHRSEMDVPVMVGVGAAFDFVAGTKPQAPRWMQRSGLEWLFRLGCEPGRLWKRYLIGNAYFIWLLLTEVLRRKR